MIDKIEPKPELGFAGEQEKVLRRKRGKLNIFLGMASGVGKTCAMLQSAQKEKLAGRDVVIGCIEFHGSRAAEILAQGLPLASRNQAAGDKSSSEADLDVLLARRPALVVMDDLAHLNAPDSRHPKRYQDVLELLEAGLDVSATLNVQNVASRADFAREITGTDIREVVPDSVLDAAEIELVDLPPEKLLKRLEERNVSLSADSARAKSNMFREEGLLVLRELTARLFAERMGRDLQKTLLRGAWKSGHRLLVAVSAKPDSEHIVRWTRRLADSLNSQWIALYIEGSRAVGEEEQAQLARNLALARELGAEVVTTTDDDPIQGLLRIAWQRNVTQIIVEKPSKGSWWRRTARDLMLRRLIRESGTMEIHVVLGGNTAPSKPPVQRKLDKSIFLQYVLALGVVALTTVAAFAFTPVVGPHATALVFLLMVVALALFVERGPTLAAAAMSAILWDFFFLSPIYTFSITNFEDAMLFGMYFVVALALGQLTTRIRAQEEAERRREARATSLYLLTRELNEATGLDQMLQRAVRQMEHVFEAQVAVLLRDLPDRLKPHPTGSFKIKTSDDHVPAWVLENGQWAGKFTENLSMAEGLYVPLATGSGPVGVIGLRLNQSFPPTIHQRHLLDAFSRQIALAVDRHRLNEMSERAKLLAESERLSKTLLDSMSHEIRTPIAAIKSATSNLLEVREGESELQQGMIAEIQEATERLNRLVGNVLEVSRLESGTVKPRLNECDVSDLVNLAAAETEKELAGHRVTVQIAPGLPVVRMDFVLMQQALTNLLSNAALHTPAGTEVEVTARLEEEALALTVADRGPGIHPDIMERIFDKFYRAPNAPAGGTGLGLSLVKGFVEAQGGRVRAANRKGGGAIFAIYLPVNRIPSAEANL